MRKKLDRLEIKSELKPETSIELADEMEKLKEVEGENRTLYRVVFSDVCFVWNKPECLHIRVKSPKGRNSEHEIVVPNSSIEDFEEST